MSDMSGASGGGKFKPVDSSFMRAPQQKSPEEKLRDVSEMYEKHFLREMMKAMRSTVHESGFIKANHAEKIFREQLDDQYVEKWNDRGGIGLSNLIYDQLVEKFGAQLGLKAPVQKPQGPLPIDEKSHFKPTGFQHPGKKESLSYKFSVPEQLNQNENSVKSPWDGVLLGKKTLGDSQTALEIQHDNGLKSQMVFKGAVSNVSTGERLQAGETLGFLSPEAKALYWTVEPRPDSVSE